MAPAKNNKPPENNPWSWTAQVAPSDVKSLHMYSAYRITGFPPCIENRRNCKRNPYCLLGLGEKKWREENEGEEEDEGGAFRCEGEYAGLQNLGATCYVNSLLQLWFHNPIFRPAILKWTPSLSEIQRNYKPKCPLAQLQAIFARLKVSKRSKIDPSDFVSSLSLNTGEQQDAQEFSKLFMDYIVKLLSEYGDEHIRKLIAQSFNGQMQYETECSGCKNKTQRPEGFTELNLNVKKHLSESLDELLEEEIISDYMCSNCRTKNTVTRRMQLVKLPPVLNLQLMRFVYDREAQRRKKVTQNISFPEVLDIQQRIHGVPSDADPSTFKYHLTAVLIHNGPSASSGHYVAQIKDSRNGEWLKFNDEYVDTVSKSRSQKSSKEEPDDAEKRSKKETKSKNSPSLTSSGAYMLVYTLERHINNPEPDPELHQYLMDLVRLEDQTFEEEMNKNKSEKDFELAVKNQRRKEVEWLYGFRKSKEAKEDVSESNNENIEEPKSKIPRIDTESSSMRSEGGENVTVLGEKRNVDKSKSSDSLSSTRKNVNGNGGVNAVKSPKSNGAASEVSPLPPKKQNYNITENDFISVDWITQWLDPGNPVPPVENGMLLCEHRKLAPPLPNSSACLYRIIPSPLASVWYEHYQGGPRLNSEDLCLLCVKNQCEKLRSLAELDEDAKQVAEIVKKWDVEYSSYTKANRSIPDSMLADKYWISKDSFRNWKRISKNKIDGPPPNATGNGTPTDDKDSEVQEVPEELMDQLGPFNADLFCEHGCLSPEANSRKIIPAEAWTIICKYFMDPVALEVIGTVSCDECRNQEQANSEAVQQNKEVAAHQKAALLDLYYNRNRPDVNMVGLRYVVSNAFVTEWRRFIRDPGKNDVVVKINNRALICEHDKFIYPVMFVSEFLKFDEDASEMVCLVTPDEWEFIKANFKCDKEIKVTVANLKKTDNLVYDPDICSECAENWLEKAYLKQFVYDEAPIYIIRREKGESIESEEDETASVKDSPPIVTGKREVKPVNLDAWMHSFAPNSSGTVRRSQRPRNSKGGKVYKVASTMTIKALKQKICTDFKALLSDQHLFYEGNELTDLTRTLNNYQIPVRGKIYLEIDTEENGEEYVEEAGTSVETGFQGTLLIGGNGIGDTRSPVQHS